LRGEFGAFKIRFLVGIVLIAMALAREPLRQDG